jgi:hypothetical protein
MSGVKVIGKMPTPRAVRGALDQATRDATRDTGRAVLPVVRGAAPGGLGAAIELSVRQTADGHSATIGPAKRKRYKGGVTGARVVRWVTRGTGVYRSGLGRKRPITSKRGVLGTMTLPGGIRVRSVKGQRPNPFISRASDRATAAAKRAAHKGADHAADRLRAL